MATYPIRATVPTVMEGLNTYTYTVTAAAAGLHYVKVRATEQTPSGLSIVINLNGSPLATSPAPTATQIHSEIQVLNFVCVASDVITVVVSSAAAIDALRNTVKTTITLGKSGI
jgi:hypothetical protein